MCNVLAQDQDAQDIMISDCNRGVVTTNNSQGQKYPL